MDNVQVNFSTILKYEIEFTDYSGDPVNTTVGALPLGAMYFLLRADNAYIQRVEYSQDAIVMDNVYTINTVDGLTPMFDYVIEAVEAERGKYLLKLQNRAFDETAHEKLDVSFEVVFVEDPAYGTTMSDYYTTGTVEIDYEYNLSYDMTSGDHPVVLSNMP